VWYSDGKVNIAGTFGEGMRLYYNEESDFLEIAVGKPSECYAVEVEPGVFLRRDEKTDEVKSIGILGFKKRSKDLKDIGLALPIDLQMVA